MKIVDVTYMEFLTFFFHLNVIHGQKCAKIHNFQNFLNFAEISEHVQFSRTPEIWTKNKNLVCQYLINFNCPSFFYDCAVGSS